LTSGNQIRFPEEYGQPVFGKSPVAHALESLMGLGIELNVLIDIANERRRQNEKWGEQNHPAEIWLAVLSEELGEVSQALLHNKFGGKAAGTLRTELVQVAAVAIQWLECIDRNGGEELEVFMGQSDLNEDD
jgi:NTP pyrophosphatase (non-canonical NTP hydrolase)